MSNRLLLVGSIPLDTVQEVFQTFGAPLGRFLYSLPDGEVGPRRHWISRVHYQVFAGHPELEILRHPRPDNGVERLNPHDYSDAWQFQVRDGIQRVSFGEPGWRLGYARDAINSYFVFTTLREKGVIPAHLRFQVSLPMVNSVVAPRIFPNPGDLEKMKPGYEAALRAEVAKIVEKIPARDLAIQWDCAHEVSDVHGAVPPFPREGAIERNLVQVRNLAPRRGLSGGDSQHGAVPGARRRSAEIPAGLRRRCVLRLRTHSRIRNAAHSGRTLAGNEAGRADLTRCRRGDMVFLEEMLLQSISNFNREIEEGSAIVRCCPNVIIRE